MKNQKKKNRKARKRTKDKNIISIVDEREERRRKIRVQAAKSRKKKGVKSIKEQMMQDMAVDYGSIAAIQAANGGKVIKNKKKKSLAKRMKICIIIMAVVFITLSFSIANIVSLKIEESKAKADLKYLEEQEIDLKNQVEELGSDEYIEQQARNWLKMAKQGEIVYVLTDTDGKEVK